MHHHEVKLDFGISTQRSTSWVETSLSAWPNPFARQVEFQLQLPIGVEVDMTLYNALGQEVAKITQGTLAAGDHRFSWTAAGQPEGVYVLRTTVGGQALPTKRLILQR